MSTFLSYKKSVSVFAKRIAHYLYRHRTYTLPAGLIAVGLLLIVLLPSSSSSSSHSASAYYAFDIVTSSPLLLQDQEIRLSDGSTTTWQTLQNNRPTLVVLWASWCASCRADLPLLQEIATTYHNDINVIGLTMGESKSTINRSIEDAGVDFPFIVDGEALAEILDIQTIPTYVFLDRDNTMVDIVTHTPSWEDMGLLLDAGL